MTHDGPHRRIVMRAKIEADSWEDLYGHLRSLTTEMACNDKRLSKQSVSGGYSSGHIIVIEENEDMTHDKWAADTDSGRRKYGRLPKSHQIQKIGNMVCPGMARAIIAANECEPVAQDERAVA